MNQWFLVIWLLYAEDAETVPKEFRPPTEAELHQFFLPYRGFCARKGVNILQNLYLNRIFLLFSPYFIHKMHLESPCLKKKRACLHFQIVAKELIIHDIDVPSALIDYISNHSISNIVVGASSRNAIMRSVSLFAFAAGKILTANLKKLV